MINQYLLRRGQTLTNWSTDRKTPVAFLDLVEVHFQPRHHAYIFVVSMMPS